MFVPKFGSVEFRKVLTNDAISRVFVSVDLLLKAALRNICSFAVEKITLDIVIRLKSFHFLYFHFESV